MYAQHNATMLQHGVLWRIRIAAMLARLGVICVFVGYGGVPFLEYMMCLQQYIVRMHQCTPQFDDCM